MNDDTAPAPQHAPTEPARGDLAREAMADVAAAHDLQARKRGRLLAIIGVVVGAFVLGGPLLVVIGGAVTTVRERAAYVAIRSRNAEYDCCERGGGTILPQCEGVSSDAAWLAADVRAREASPRMWLSKRLGGALGTGDLELGGQPDLAATEELAKDCAARR